MTLNDKDRLLLFLFRVDELRKRTFYPHARSFEADTEMHLSDIGEEQFIAFLVSFRHFWLQREPTHLDSIAKLIRRHAHERQDKELMEAAEDAECRFKAAKGELQSIGSQGEVLGRVTEQEVFDLWLDTRYFHNDPQGFGLFIAGNEDTLDRLKGYFLYCLRRHLIRLEDYQPMARSSSCGEGCHTAA